MKRTTQRVGAAALASAVLFLVGCSVPSPTPSEESPEPVAEVTSNPPSPSPSPSASLLSTVPAEVPFEFDTSVFPDSWVLQWVDKFANAPQFTPVPLETPVEGMRLYRDELTQCEILLFAGEYFGPIPIGPTDRALSDSGLKVLTDQGDDVISEFAYDHTVPQPDGSGSIAARAIVGAHAEGSSSFATTRVIESRGQEASALIACPGDEASQLYEGLTTSSVLALTIAPPPS